MVRPKPLADRIKELRAECDRYIDSRAELVCKETGGSVPLAVLRGLITNNAPGCECRAALLEIETARVEAELKEQAEEATA